MILIFALIFSLSIANAKSDKTLDLLEKELNYNFEGLKKREIAPYFISYSLTETKSLKIYSSNYMSIV